MVKIRKLKIMPLVLSAVLLFAGIVVLALSYVGMQESALAITIGTLILGVGATRLVYGFLTYTEELDARNNITLGVLDVIWSILMLVLNNNPFAFIILFGLWCMVASALEIIEIIKNALDKKPYLHLLGDAIINFVFGMFLLIANASIEGFSTYAGAYLVVNALTAGLITMLSIPGFRLGHKEQPAAPVAEVPAQEPVKEEKEEVVAPVEEVEEKPVAKKTTTTKKATTAKKPAATTAKKSTAAKSTTAKKTTTTKKTTKAE